MLVIVLVGLAQAADWRLVGAYDVTAVGALGDAPSGFVWTASPGMEQSCGPVKHPDGLGIFEAEAVGSGLSPALTLVLERTEGEGGLTPGDVRVALTDGDHRVLLQPMVVPRRLRVRITGAPGTERFQQLVRTQLEIETCLEHKTGRAWTGQDTERLRQAFLLDEPVGVDATRRYFGGQADPVPALLGPPDACVVTGTRATPRDAGRGEGANDLVPTDVWGASLRACGPADEGRHGADGELPLRWSGDDPGAWSPERHWLDVLIDLRTVALSDGSTGIDGTVTVDGEVVLDGPLLARENLGEGDDELQIEDVLAWMPYRYPALGTDDDPARYTVLVVPEWQVVEALRRLERVQTPGGAATSTPMYTSPIGITDGVGTVLANPHLLLLQVEPDGDSGQGWPNLATVLRGDGWSGPRGHTVGQLAARTSVVVASGQPPTWSQTSAAQRAQEQAVLIGSFAVLLTGLLAGLRRVRDLWARVPTERAEYWPGAGDLVLTEVEGLNASGPEEGE